MFLSKLVFRILWLIGQWTTPKFAKTLFMWGIKSRIFPINVRGNPLLETNLFGKKLKSPVGLSSDFDYTGEAFDLLVPLGISFGELGSYTLSPNFSPVSMKFLRRDKALRIHSDEINNPGIKKAANILASRRYLPHLVGVSLVSFGMEEINTQNGTSVYTYLEDYKQMTYQVAPYTDYIVINLSHPNATLCQVISDESTILPLIQTVQEAASVAAPILTPKIAVKVPYDLSDLEIKTVTGMLLRVGVDAVIVAGPAGSGKNIKQTLGDPLAVLDHSNLVLGAPLQFGMIGLIKRFYNESHGKLCLIASGGIQTGSDAYEAIAAGASAVEIGSALLIKGPEVIHKINRDLAILMKQRNVRSIAELVGRNSIFE